MDPESKQKVETYVQQAIRYLDNARSELSNGELEKAGEFLWGSFAQALKALAMAKKSVEIRTHSELWDLARSAAKELGDESIYTGFREANSLHSNFYEVRLGKEDLEISIERIRRQVAKLIKLAREAGLTAAALSPSP